MITARSKDGVTAVKGRRTLGVVPSGTRRPGLAPVFSLQPEKVEAAFDEIRQRGQQLALPEPRLRDTRNEEEDSIN